MPRKITIKDLKNKRDYNAWKIELEDHKMADTHAKHDAAVAELARREEMRIDTLKDTLWEAAVPFFGVSITPEELKKYFELLMNDNRNAGLVRKLKALEEERVKEIEAAENARLEVLRSAHEKLYEKYEKIKGMDKSEESAASDSGSGSDETSPFSDSDNIVDEASDSEVIMEEPTENEINEGYYMTEPEEEDFSKEYTE